VLFKIADPYYWLSVFRKKECNAARVFISIMPLRKVKPTTCNRVSSISSVTTNCSELVSLCQHDVCVILWVVIVDFLWKSRTFNEAVFPIAEIKNLSPFFRADVRIKT
jgi:hypothetical protein